MKIFSENEWDGKPLKYCLILCLCIFLIPQFILADRTISGIKNSDPQLKKEEIELAEEYQDIISQIEKISNDYQEYFSKIDNKYAKKYKEVLIKILLKINHGKYCGQVDYLLDDLNRFTQELNVREQSLKNQQDQKKFYRLVRNLRSQINLLAEYLKEDISERFAADKESLKNIEGIFISNATGLCYLAFGGPAASYWTPTYWWIHEKTGPIPGMVVNELGKRTISSTMAVSSRAISC